MAKSTRASAEQKVSRAASERLKGLFPEADATRIAEAIARAERKTSGEIVAVVTAESSTYLYAPVMWAALLALLVPWPLIYFTWVAVQWIYVAQLLVFLALLILFLPRPVRYWLVPRAVKHARAHRRATEQFLAQGLHTTAGRTGVLIFVSVAERYAEILADTGIEERVPKGTWQGLVDDLTAHIGRGAATEGFLRTIAGCGEHLARHFPPGSSDPNELPDHLIVLG